MEKGLLHLHNVNRWIIVASLLIVLIKLFSGAKDNKLRKTALILLIASHIQLLIGLYQYFVGASGIKLLNVLPAGESVMKNALARFWVVEHFASMLIAIILITMAYSNIKKSVKAGVVASKAKWLLIVAILLIFAGMPWLFRSGIGRPWFPGL